MEARQTTILNVHGVRGSFPAPERSCMEYGGNTSCCSIEYPDRILVFDAGTGIEQVAWNGKPIHVFLSHFHMDHVMGLFCWQALFCREAEIHFYGEGESGGELEARLGQLFADRFWPVKLADAAARLVFHPFAPGKEVCFPGEGGRGCRISAMASLHPNSCMLFRLTEGTHRLIYMLDYELGQAGKEVRGALEQFVYGADYLIFDAQYTMEELPAHRGWGHSAWEQGLELGRAAKAGCVMMAHYDRSHGDAFLREQEKRAKKLDERCVFLRERRLYPLW